MGRYFKYAIGEILLVVVGILLALQVNSWQEQRARAKKEISYLKDIKVNLEDDIISINRVVEFNERKMNLTDSTFYTLEQSSDPKIYLPLIIRYMHTLTMYDVFETNKVAFDNMVASENVDLITDTNLRSQLTRYYKREYNYTTQESVKQRSRQLGDYAGIAMFNKQTMERLINRGSSLRDISEVTIHRDPKIYSYLFNMLMTTQSQTETLIETQQDIRELIQLIDQQLQ